MISETQFLALLERATAETPIAAAGALTETMEALKVEARAYIGHELPEWPPLAASTVAEKERLGYVGHVSETDPLLRTGHLRESIEVSIDGLTGVLGSTEPVALWQELGTSRIPPRPFLSLALFHSQPIAAPLFGRALMKVLTP